MAKTSVTAPPRRSSHSVQSTQRGKINASTTKARKKLNEMSPDMNWGLGMARVVNVDYEEFTVTLRTLSGASQMYQRVPVPMTFPGAGMRHFFGAMPEIGDHCVVGWSAQESSEKGGGTKTPIVLAWVTPGTAFARDWATAASFDPDEYDLSSPREKGLVEGAHSITRRKLRHIQPGNIVASSSQGSDLVLDESILLSNRRGNEIRLRDQDQALVLRSLQQFHAMAGARIYAGMVQRDTTFLQKTMVSDGTSWDDLFQSYNGQPFSETENTQTPNTPSGFLSPAAVLARSRLTDGSKGRATIPVEPNLDPYLFLTRGGFINELGFVTDDKHDADGYYGGKPIYRVASSGKTNATIDADAPTFTEYRIEVNHTSTGRLPVSEQTDMFDADRLPLSNPNAKTNVPPPNVPFMEFVLGSVVGNDAYSPEGRKKYGLPLVAKVFEGDTFVPRLDAADLGIKGQGATPVGEHLASLFRMVPPVENTESSGTFWGVNKSGQFKASIGGDPKQFSAEVAMSGSLKIGLGGGMRFISDGHLEWVTRNKASLNMTAPEGSVYIYGGGPTKSNAAAGERANGTDGGEGDLPAVNIQAKTNMRLQAEKLVAIKAGTLTTNSTVANLTAHEELTLDGVRKTSISSENYQLSVSGKAQESYGGPKYGLPTNMPLHERTYTPLSPGTCEKVTYTLGDREEQFYLGNHTTTILVGNMLYQTFSGTWSAVAMGSSMAMGSSGISALATTGVLSLKAGAGAATMSGQASATMSTPGLATVRGGAGIYLAAPVTGTDFGPIICAGTLEPLTGLPFATWGLGAKNHIVGA